MSYVALEHMRPMMTNQTLRRILHIRAVSSEPTLAIKTAPSEDSDQAVQVTFSDTEANSLLRLKTHHHCFEYTVNTQQNVQKHMFLPDSLRWAQMIVNVFWTSHLTSDRIEMWAVSSSQQIS